MFYFFIKIFISLLIIFSIYHFFSQKEITILEILVLSFIFNICTFSLFYNINVLYMMISSLLVFVFYFLYVFLYKKSISKKILDGDKVLINRGIINFHELIKENYSYDTLLFQLKKRGIANPSLVDYCIKKGNDLIIFKKNSIKNYPISIIIDGKILTDNLLSIDKSNSWLIKKLEESNLKISDINYAYFKNKELHFITN